MPLEESITLLAEQMRGEEPTLETMKLLQAIWPTMGARARLDLLQRLVEWGDIRWLRVL